MFKYAPGIAFEELIVFVNEYFKNLNYVCHRSAISGGATLTLESQPFPYKSQYTNITILVEIYKNTRKVKIQGGKTAIYKLLEHHQEIFECLNGKSKVDEREVEENNESNVQEIHSIPEQSQTILQTVSNYTIAQDLVAQEHPATPDLSPPSNLHFKT